MKSNGAFWAPSGKSLVLGGVTYADHGAKDVRNLSKLELGADDYYFSPAFLRGKPGQKLTLLIENEASNVHNMSISALGIDKDTSPKGKVQVDATFPASGMLTVSCKFHGSLGKNHLDKPPTRSDRRRNLNPSGDQEKADACASVRGDSMRASDRLKSPLQIRRRGFLKAAGAGSALAVAGGLESVLGAGKAPAFAQATRLHILHWVDFIPEGDVEMRRQVAEYGAQMKVEIQFETINANDLQARITAAIQSGTGADIIQMLHNWPHLYQNALVDISDLGEWKAKDQGGYYPQMEAAARVAKRWLALPYGIVPGQIAYRKSWFAEVGAMEPPKTLVEYRKLGTALKKKGKPLGQTLGHTFGDAPGWTYPMLWSFGGAETDQSGKKVVLNSKATVESVKWMTALWKDACDEGALAWDDTNNNRAFHAGEISATLNGASIYIFAKRNPDKIKDDKGQPMWHDISHFPIPDGPLGRTPSYQASFSHAVMKYSRNQAAAKEFLKWLHSKEQFGKWFEVEFGYTIGATTFWENHPLWQKVDDALKPFRIAAHGSRMFGYAGPPTAKAAEAYSKYVITDIYAKAAQGMPAEDAVKWAEGELKKIYEG